MTQRDDRPMRFSIDPGRPILVLSDTHGRLSDAVIQKLLGAQLILHAGDIDTAETLAEIEAIGPVVVARGNMDLGGWAREIPAVRVLVVNDYCIRIVHNLAHLGELDRGEAVDLVVHGHTHTPAIETDNHTLIVNPGSASLPKLGMTPSLMRIWLRENGLEAELVVP
ncbi:metallophosphoesterase family protein [Desulfatirhabdium butyrativorans]|uniref:metallophosphoesterase family protein n=1 Tax=Desulfatirhabdium butyrativorans TaxID=340467 RepID=UPI000688DEB8|nr:YfcE family phosphodiesterase [Desulfatirhabdium butyrativorans]